jgi:tRNA U38,U39,U40 pseudouridine synthase TruA
VSRITPESCTNGDGGALQPMSDNSNDASIQGDSFLQESVRRLMGQACTLAWRGGSRRRQGQGQRR